ncbi:MAG: hypothetical protein ACK55Z_29915, partial [bacterium]
LDLLHENHRRIPRSIDRGEERRGRIAKENSRNMVCSFEKLHIIILRGYTCLYRLKHWRKAHFTFQ